MQASLASERLSRPFSKPSRAPCFHDVDLDPYLFHAPRIHVDPFLFVFPGRGQSRRHYDPLRGFLLHGFILHRPHEFLFLIFHGLLLHRLLGIHHHGKPLCANLLLGSVCHLSRPAFKKLAVDGYKQLMKSAGTIIHNLSAQREMVGKLKCVTKTQASLASKQKRLR